MHMIVIPAIDLKGGRVVRLEQGMMDRDKAYSDDPAAVARKWASMGAELIHVVDLEGAFAGGPVNREAVLDVVKAVDVPVELGGGLRRMHTIKSYLQEGVHRVVLGTAAHKDPQLVERASEAYPKRIAVGVDAREGKVSVKGWAELTDVPAAELAAPYQGMEVAAIIYTDIKRDGMMTGPSVESTADLARKISLPVIASGGVKTIEHIMQIKKHEEDGVIGVITGRAIYEGTLDLARAIKIAKDAGE